MSGGARHDWYLDDDGLIDIWRLDYGYHNGPECRRCHDSFCHHCEPDCYDSTCDAVIDVDGDVIGSKAVES